MAVWATVQAGEPPGAPPVPVVLESELGAGEGRRAGAAGRDPLVSLRSALYDRGAVKSGAPRPKAAAAAALKAALPEGGGGLRRAARGWEPVCGASTHTRTPCPISSGTARISHENSAPPGVLARAFAQGGARLPPSQKPALTSRAASTGAAGTATSSRGASSAGTCPRLPSESPAFAPSSADAPAATAFTNPFAAAFKELSL